MYNLLSTYFCQAISFKPYNNPEINVALVYGSEAQVQKGNTFVQGGLGGQERLTRKFSFKRLENTEQVLFAFGSLMPTADSGPNGCSVIIRLMEPSHCVVCQL